MLGNALGGGVKMAVDLARMAVGLPPTAVPVSGAVALSARSGEPGTPDWSAMTSRETAALAEPDQKESDLPDLWSLGDGNFGRPLIGRDGDES